jgi:hypothetical protein
MSSKRKQSTLSQSSQSESDTDSKRQKPVAQSRCEEINCRVTQINYTPSNILLNIDKNLKVASEEFCQHMELRQKMPHLKRKYTHFMAERFEILLIRYGGQTRPNKNGEYCMKRGSFNTVLVKQRLV